MTNDIVSAGADEDPAGRGGAGLGAGLDHHHPVLRIHQPHHPARGAREVQLYFALILFFHITKALSTS